MKSLMLRSSRAFLGGGGFFGLWAAPGDICTLTFVSVVSKKKEKHDCACARKYITGAPGVAPVAGKPGLMGAPGAPDFSTHRGKK